LNLIRSQRARGSFDAVQKGQAGRTQGKMERLKYEEEE
jgi:hypothetical protein